MKENDEENCQGNPHIDLEIKTANEKKIEGEGTREEIGNFTMTKEEIENFAERGSAGKLTLQIYNLLFVSV